MIDTGDALGARFEQLAGRFFDGALTPDEDQEFVCLLESNPALARQFIRQVELERLLCGVASGDRLADSEFAQIVRRSIDLHQNEVEAQRFAGEIVRMVRNRAARRSVRARAPRAVPGWSPWTVGIATAACLLLAVLLFSTATTRNPQRPANPPAEVAVRVEPVDLGRAQHSENAGEVAIREQDRPPLPTHSFFTDTEPVRQNEPKGPASAQNKTPGRPIPPAKEAAAAAADAGHRIAVLAEARQVRVSVERAGTTHQLTDREFLQSGDLVRVAATESSPNPSAAFAALVLPDDSVLLAYDGTELQLNASAEQLQPVLRRGAMRAQVAKQAPQRRLVFATPQGPEAAVLGTRFRLLAEPAAKRVTLQVEEGKVAFRNKGVERIVSADETAYADDDRPPVTPWQYRPKAASLAGMVLSRDSNVPVAKATVTVFPLADRKSQSFKAETETDAQGRFEVGGLPEGWAYVLVRAEDGGSRGVQGRGTVTRVQLQGGETIQTTLKLDRAALVLGRLSESTGKPLTGAKVFLLPQNSDGQTLHFVPTQPLTPDYAALALEGAGRYTASVWVPGMLARVRYGKLNDVRPDRIVNWPIEVQLQPSAVLRGHIVDAPSGRWLADAPGTTLADPQQPRTILVLRAATGQTQSQLAEADGSFDFNTNLEPGAYDLMVTRFGYQPWTTRVQLTTGRATELNVPLEPARISTRAY